jgi:hypothetical protein
MLNDTARAELERALERYDQLAAENDKRADKASRDLDTYRQVATSARRRSAELRAVL